VATVGLSVASGSTAFAGAGTVAASTPVVTRAALDPSLVSGRGADVGFVQARNVGAVGVNNCGSFHFTAAGSEFSLTDLGGNTGGGTTGPWLAPWELPNTITCNDRPPVVPPPPPSSW
jgi:hypothetical protein